jgi:hypothetical protein
MVKWFLDKIVSLEAVRAFLEQWGLWRVLATATAIVVAALIAAWGWLTSNLPMWAVTLVFLGAVVLLLACLKLIMSILSKWRQDRQFRAFVAIDRDELATELAEMSRKVATLLGEFLGPMQQAWVDGNAELQAGKVSFRDNEVRVVGRMLERYSEKYGADVWRLVRRASKVVQLDRREIWFLEHGVRSDHDLVQIYRYLASLSDDVRSPTLPLAMLDEARDGRRN